MIKKELIYSQRKQTILVYLGISEKKWNKACAQNSELVSLTPEILIRHIKENAEGLNFDHRAWISLCQKKPQLYVMNLDTLKRHIAENAKLMNLSESDWIKTCKTEPELFIYNCETLEKKYTFKRSCFGYI